MDTARKLLLSIHRRDLQHEIEQARREGYSWREIAEAAEMPLYAAMAVGGETAKNRPTVDRR